MWCSELANEFNNRNNEFKIGAVSGTVLGISPIRIAILGNKIIVDENNSKVSSRIYDLIKDGKLMGGDSVVVIACDNNKTFFIIDKLGVA